MPSVDGESMVGRLFRRLRAVCVGGGLGGIAGAASGAAWSLVGLIANGSTT